jgi:hypothetical protein
MFMTSLRPLPMAIVLITLATAVIAAFAIGLATGSVSSQPVGSAFWTDVAKTAIGAFLGAGLAFTSTMLVQWFARDNEHVRAGNVALVVLVQQINDFLAMKASMLRQRTKALAARPNTPIWLQLLPSQYVFTADRIDPSTLPFLFDKHGAEAMQKVLHVQKLHATLVSLVTEHREVRIAIQQRQSEAGITAFDPKPMEEIERTIGPYLLARAASATEALLEGFQTDEPTYDAAFRMLRAELRRRFGKRFIDMATPDRPKGVHDETGKH